MVYNANIPQATDEQSQSQIDILNNFITANASFGANHVDFATVANSGKHTVVEFINQPAAPATAALTNKMYALSPSPILGPVIYSRAQNSGTPGPITPITGNAVVPAGAPGVVSILDFNGITSAIFKVEGLLPTRLIYCMGSYGGGVFTSLLNSASGIWLTGVRTSGTVLQLANDPGGITIPYTITFLQVS